MAPPDHAVLGAELRRAGDQREVASWACDSQLRGDRCHDADIGRRGLCKLLVQHIHRDEAAMTAVSGGNEDPVALLQLVQVPERLAVAVAVAGQYDVADLPRHRSTRLVADRAPIQLGGAIPLTIGNREGSPSVWRRGSA